MYFSKTRLTEGKNTEAFKLELALRGIFKAEWMPLGCKPIPLPSPPPLPIAVQRRSTTTYNFLHVTQKPAIPAINELLGRFVILVQGL